MTAPNVLEMVGSRNEGPFVKVNFVDVIILIRTTYVRIQVNQSILYKIFSNGYEIWIIDLDDSFLHYYRGKDSFNDFLNALAAFLPIGLFLAAIPPNLIVINS